MVFHRYSEARQLAVDSTGRVIGIKVLSIPKGSADAEIATRFPVGTQLRILPNHACATGAQFPEYHALDDAGKLEVWSRFYGW